jgi:hypothetical protein
VRTTTSRPSAHAVATLAMLGTLAACGLSDDNAASLLAAPEALLATTFTEMDGDGGESWEEWDGTAYILAVGDGGGLWAQLYHNFCPTLDADEPGHNELAADVFRVRGGTLDVDEACEAHSNSPWVNRGSGGTATGAFSPILTPAPTPLIDTGLDDDSCLPLEPDTRLTLHFDELVYRPDDGKDSDQGGGRRVLDDVTWEMDLVNCGAW